MTASDSASVLSEEKCWDVLTSVDVGRVAIRVADDIDIFPVNFLVRDGLVYFRTAPGTKIIELTSAPRVAFEADGTRGTRYWSVAIKGDARRLDSDAEIVASGILRLHSLDPAAKWNYVRITPRSISGRHFEPVRRPEEEQP